MTSDQQDSFTQPESFRRDGFVLIPGVLTNDRVEHHRSHLAKLAAGYGAGRHTTGPEDILASDALREFAIEVQFSEKLVEVIRAIVGPVVSYVPDLQLHHNKFGLAGPSQGWHLDCGSEADDLRNTYLYDDNYLFGKVGLVLQDNTADLGGGISVIPGSHRAFRHAGRATGSLLYRTLYNRLNRHSPSSLSRREVRLPLTAGSAVYFDSRLLHRSTPPLALAPSAYHQAGQCSELVTRTGHGKHILYWEACTPVHAESHLRNAARRAATEEASLPADSSTPPFYTHYLSLRFPDDYPADYVTAARRSGVEVVGLDPESAAFWKRAAAST